MSFRSAAQLEREFFRAFFAALRTRGLTRIEWRSPETVSRFRDVSEFFLDHATDHDDVSRLADRLRPDPISGLVPALDANIASMQPGSVGNPNPSYSSVTVSNVQVFEETWAEQMSPAIRKLVPGAVIAFLREDATQGSDDANSVEDASSPP